MGLFTRGGIVFNAATTDWARVLASGHPQVDRITRNVLDRLRSRSLRILGLNGACSSTPAVEGTTVTFHTDVSALPNASGLTYQWQASAGTAGITNLPTFVLQLPSPVESVTVTVTVSDGTDCPGFGTFTFVPMTQAEYAHAQIICAIRELVITSAVWRGPAHGVRDRIPWLVDPLWDPLRGYLARPLHPPELERVARIGQALTKRAGDLAKNSKKLRGLPRKRPS
jgi:hypothetical protein